MRLYTWGNPAAFSGITDLHTYRTHRRLKLRTTDMQQLTAKLSVATEEKGNLILNKIKIKYWVKRYLSLSPLHMLTSTMMCGLTFCPLSLWVTQRMTDNSSSTNLNASLVLLTSHHVLALDVPFVLGVDSSCDLLTLYFVPLQTIILLMDLPPICALI